MTLYRTRTEETDEHRTRHHQPGPARTASSAGPAAAAAATATAAPDDAATADAPLARARDFAGRFLHASTDAIGLAKNVLNQTFDLDFDAALELEAHSQSIARTTAYHRDSVERFTSKQPLPFNWDHMDRADKK